MRKEKYPIIEFDEDLEGIIDPVFVMRKHEKMHDHLVICFFMDAIETLLEEGTIIKTDTIKGENHCDIYAFKDRDISLVPGKLGGAASGGFLEDFIAMGVKYVMFVGGGGVLSSDITVGKFVVIDSAIRDEGLSYHYLKPSREVEADLEVVSKITKYLDHNRLPYIQGKTWTTDAFYRETKARIRRRKEEGALVVEMEQASLMAVSVFRKIKYGAIIYGGDDISLDVWDSREWRSRGDIRLALALHAANIVKTFSE